MAQVTINRGILIRHYYGVCVCGRESLALCRNKVSIMNYRGASLVCNGELSSSKSTPRNVCGVA